MMLPADYSPDGDCDTPGPLARRMAREAQDNMVPCPRSGYYGDVAYLDPACPICHGRHVMTMQAAAKWMRSKLVTERDTPVQRPEVA